MGVLCTIENDFLLVRCFEHFTTEDIIAAIESTWNAAKERGSWQQPLPVLADLRGSLESANQAEVQRRGALIAQYPRLFAKRFAAVVSDRLHYGLARQGGSYAELDGVEHAIFYDFEQARSWLVEAARRGT